MRIKVLSIALILVSAVFSLQAQYAPAAGMPGSTAIHADSSIIQSWASSVSVQRGWINAADTSLGLASFGGDSAALGKADNNIISLGDGGVATLQFELPIKNGPGWDFVVFENSFDGAYLELAHVEVSSDGQHFVRFPSHSLTPTAQQVGAFGTIDPTQINNLAGKYKVMYGTPFDLEEFIALSSVNINQITHVRLVDVFGSVQSAFGSKDTAGNYINDPWPTAFPSSGFDLDAVGIIHSTVGIEKQESKTSFAQIQLATFPNPANTSVTVRWETSHAVEKLELYTLGGRLMLQEFTNEKQIQLDIRSCESGMYLIRVCFANGECAVDKLMVN